MSEYYSHKMLSCYIEWLLALNVTVEKKTLQRGVCGGSRDIVRVCMGRSCSRTGFMHIPLRFALELFEAPSSPDGSVHNEECTGLRVLLSSQEDNTAWMQACMHAHIQCTFPPFTQRVWVT